MPAKHNTDSPSRNEPKVSVCIPTYNAAHTIRKCLESIFKQTVKPYEILVVDGHSQDETQKILQEYPNIKIVGFEKGIGKARKTLVSNANGDIIAWIDADIIVPLNWIEQNVQIHLKRKDILILSGEIPMHTCSVDENVSNVTCKPTSINESLGSSQAACTMKKKLFDVVNYDERFRRSEDWDLVVSAHQRGIKLHLCNGLKFSHIGRSAKIYLKDMIYAGTYVLFLRKYGLWYIKFNPRHLVAFAFRIALIYAIPFSLLFPFVLMVYPIAFLAYAIHGKTPIFSKASAFKLLAEMMKGIGEHLYMFKVI